MGMGLGRVLLQFLAYYPLGGPYKKFNLDTPVSAPNGADFFCCANGAERRPRDIASYH